MSHVLSVLNMGTRLCQILVTFTVLLYMKSPVFLVNTNAIYFSLQCATCVSNEAIRHGMTRVDLWGDMQPHLHFVSLMIELTQ